MNEPKKIVVTAGAGDIAQVYRSLEESLLSAWHWQQRIVKDMTGENHQ